MINKHRKKFIFLGVGILNTAIDFIGYSILMYVLPSSNIKLTLVGILSGTIALCVAFFTHSRITWRGIESRKGVFLRFLLFTGFGMWVIRPLLLNLFSHFTVLSDLLYKLAHPIFGNVLTYTFMSNSVNFILMTAVLLIYNFLTYDNFVFKKDKEHS